MSYIGNQPYQVAFVSDSFSGNGSTTVFTMSVAPANTASVLVAVSGVLQDPSTYSVSGTTLTFTGAPPSGTANISARYLGIPASGVTTTAYRTVTVFTATAGQTTFTPPSYTAGFINVFRNGVLLTPTSDYTATNGTTVVLATGATSGDTVLIESFLVSSVLNAIPATTGSVLSSYIQNAPSLASPTFTGTATYPGGVLNQYGVGLGSAVPSSGYGIAFPGTQSASTDANTLDDYEEGTFTPAFQPSGYTFTQNVAQGWYTKIGNQVFCKIYMSVTRTAGSGGSQGLVSGLPFTMANNNGSYGGGSIFPDTGASFFTAPLYIRGLPNGTNIGLGTGFNGNPLGYIFTWSGITSLELEISINYQTS